MTKIEETPSHTWLESLLLSANEYSNLIIACLTVALIIISWRTITLNNRSLRLNTHPLLYTKIKTEGTGLALIVENNGAYPAFDIEIIIIGIFFEEDTPLTSVAKEEILQKNPIDFTNSTYNTDNREFWSYGIIDKQLVGSIPPNRAYKSIILFNARSSDIEVIVQYRNSLGENYFFVSRHTEVLPQFQSSGEYLIESLNVGTFPVKRFDLRDLLYGHESILKWFSSVWKDTFMRKEILERLVSRIVIKREIKNDTFDILKRSLYFTAQKDVSVFSHEAVRGDIIKL